MNAPTLKAVVLYEDYSSGCRAKAFLDQLTDRLNGEVQTSLALWRIDLLQLPGGPTAALRDCGCADMVLLAVREERSLPPAALQWVEAWAKTRMAEESALLVLWGTSSPAREGVCTPAASLSELQELAQRHHVSFFCGGAAEPRRESQALRPQQQPAPEPG